MMTVADLLANPSVWSKEESHPRSAANKDMAHG
jgi:hypothetical protein